MIYSMTGYGRGEAASDGMRFIVEIKTINHRYCDINIRMPRLLNALEKKLRQKLQEEISRGKVDVYITYEEFGEREKKVKVDSELAKAYFQAMTELKHQMNLNDDISVTTFLKIPDVFMPEKNDPDDDEAWNMLSEATDAALRELLAMRGEEGGKLIADICGKIANIFNELEIIEARAPIVVKEYKEKLESRIKDLMDQSLPDENRLALEVAMFADRCSIDEELVRLKSHLSQAQEFSSFNGPVGRKLDFIIQELNRETNTIGSKANDLTINQRVVEIKSEIEKVREQAQNLE